MNTILSYLYWACGIALTLLAFFFFFKAKQAKGAGEMNEFRTSVGRGSFGASVQSTIMQPVWGLLGLAMGIAAFLTFGLAVDKGKESQASIEPASINVQATPPTSVTPTAPIAVEAQKTPAAESPHNDSQQTARPFVGANEGNKVAGDKQMPAVGGKDLAVANSDPKMAEANAIQVCEGASNFFSKNNCRFEQCAKQENMNKPECEKFLKK